MKLLTFIVPCYNSQDYMRKCINSLLPGGEIIEILLVNDGSSDNTGVVANEYADKYPTVVKVFHQENKGHGGAINTGLANTSGKYLKVVDSDDWLDESAYKKVMKLLKDLHNQQNDLDLIVANYVYEKVSANKKKIISYKGILPQNIPFKWENIERFRRGAYMLMHSLIYRTELLRECALMLPEHCFYVDNLFAYVPLQYVKTLYYINVNLYRYYIGRVDQSVNEQIMIKRIDQQLRVSKLMIEQVDIVNNKNPKLRNYLYSYLEIVLGISSIFLILSGTKKNLHKKAELWKYLKEQNSNSYKKLRKTPTGILANLPCAIHFIPKTVYRIVQHHFKFN